MRSVTKQWNAVPVLVLTATLLWAKLALGDGQVSVVARRDNTTLAPPPPNITNMTQLEGDSGSLDIILHRAEGRFFYADVSSPSSLLEVVINIRNTDSSGPDACKGLLVYASLQEVIPQLLPGNVNEDESDGNSGESSASLFAWLEASVLCRIYPELGISVKNTLDHRRYYLLLQARYTSSVAEAVEPPRCNIHIHYSQQKRAPFLWTVMGVLLVFTAASSIGFFKVNRAVAQESFQLYPSYTTLLRVHMWIPEWIRWFCVKSCMWCYVECRKRWRAHLQRPPQPEANLLSAPPTPQSVASSNEGEGSATVPAPAAVPNAVAVPTIDDDDEKLCRICKEGEEVESFIKPCGCSGSIQYVHWSCLDKWRIESSQRNPHYMTHCELCRQPFKLPIKKAAVSRVLLAKGSIFILLCITFYVVWNVTALISKVTIGELTCGAPYHDVDYRAPFGVVNTLLGILSYSMLCTAFFYASYFVWLLYVNDSAIAAERDETGVAPSFWSVQRRLSVLLYMFWLFIVLCTAGYFVKLAGFFTSRYVVWSYEIAPISGFVCLALIAVFAAICTVVVLHLRSPTRLSRNNSIVDEVPHPDHAEPLGPSDGTVGDATASSSSAPRDPTPPNTVQPGADREASETHETSSSAPADHAC